LIAGGLRQLTPTLNAPTAASSAKYHLDGHSRKLEATLRGLIQTQANGHASKGLDDVCLSLRHRSAWWLIGQFALVSRCDLTFHDWAWVLLHFSQICNFRLLVLDKKDVWRFGQLGIVSFSQNEIFREEANGVQHILRLAPIILQTEMKEVI
jgi:hypothetical protein